MLTLLADISPQDVGQIILTLMAAGGGGYSLFSLGKSRAVKVEPQPLEVQETKPYATREELNALRDKVHHDLGKITSQIGDLKAETAENKGTLNGIAATQKEILAILLKQK